jgi:hypothetical protein
MDHYNDIISKLITISTLTDGTTLSPSYDQVVTHNSWSTAIWRRYQGDSRKTTVIYIRDTLNCALELLKIGSEADQLTLKSYITQALTGFSHLKNTYKGDFDTIGLISTIIDDVNKKLNDDYLNKSDKLTPLPSDDYTQFFNDLMNGNAQAVEKFLCENQPHMINEEGKNAMHIVCNKLYYNDEILNLLYNHGVDMKAEDFYGQTPLDIAVNSGCTKAVIFLETVNNNKKKLEI